MDLRYDRISKLQRAIFGLTTGLALLPNTLQAKELTYEPTGTWLLGRADDTCFTRHTLTSGKRTILLEFDGLAGIDPVVMTLMGDDLTNVLKSKPVVLKTTTGQSYDKPRDVFRSDTGPSVYQILFRTDAQLWGSDQPGAEATALAISFGRQTITLHTGALDAPLARLQACRDHVLREWKLDPATLRTLKAGPRPMGSPGEWLTYEDVAAAKIDRVRGLVEFALVVDASGTPTGCHLRYTRGTQDLNDLVCRLLLARARFSPALDANYKPVAAYFSSRIRFTGDWR